MAKSKRADILQLLFWTGIFEIPAKTLQQKGRSVYKAKCEAGCLTISKTTALSITDRAIGDYVCPIANS